MSSPIRPPASAARVRWEKGPTGFIAAAGAQFPAAKDAAAPSCVPPPAGRGTAAWSRRLEWSLVSGTEFSGREGRPAELTVKRAGREHCCVACAHDIPRGSLYGATLAGLIHYCPCCITADKPEAQFIPGRHAA